ncbi:MAG: ubiquinone biosynthesis protein UbiA [Bacteroidetes bacterium]|nr:MAG: ubiquinone biosynthesis protein UbiA [Bacteroidota bacterium]
MKLLGPFFNLIRWPNLLFIAITQCLFHFCVVEPSVNLGLNFPLHLFTRWFVLLCASSVFIAAGGYIINDYFDVNIDLVNKPNRVWIDKAISRRWALVWHLGLSGTGVALGAIVSWQINNWLIAVANLACTILLWTYSTTYKRRLLWGNVLISALTAWVVLVLLVAEIPSWWTGRLNNPTDIQTAARLSRIGVVYAAFAFIITLIREVVKDLEDMEGDRKEGCSTMPIVWGVPASKIFVAVWLVVLVVSLVVIEVYVLTFGGLAAWLAAVYLTAFLVVPLLRFFKQLGSAVTPQHYHSMSTRLKYIMLAGILSMVFFYTTAS